MANLIGRLVALQESLAMPEEGAGLRRKDFRRKCASPSGHPVQSPVTQPTENSDLSAPACALQWFTSQERRQPRDELPKHMVRAKRLLPVILHTIGRRGRSGQA